LLREQCDKIVEDFNNNKFDRSVFNLPFVVYQVVQASKSNKYKRRLVYCPPFAITVLETIFGGLVTDSFLNNDNTAIFIGHKQIKIHNLIQSLTNFNKYSGDYSSYDQTIPSFIIAQSFEIIKNRYQFRNKFEEEMFDEVVSYNLYGPIYHPKTGVIHRNRGICSGSVFTNLIDSVANLLMINYANCITNYDISHI
jgi:hypothetical protein